MIYIIKEDQLLIHLKQMANKSDFIGSGKVIPGSYAEELLTRIYDCIISYSTNLVDEYSKYYSEEYSNFGSFLYWKYNIDDELITHILNELKPSDYILFGLAYSGGDYNLGSFIKDEENLNLLSSFFK